MAKIYSYLEVEGKPLIPPTAKPPQTDVMVYLMEFEGRHYIAVKKDLPKQFKEIQLEGPIDLKDEKNRALAEILRQRAEPRRRLAFERAADYPALSDQVGALMKEFLRRREAGETLHPELSALLDQVLEVKKKFPGDDLGLG